MPFLKIIHATTAFLLELLMLAAMSRWGYLQGNSSWARYSIATLLVLTAVILWGYFAAPKSARRLRLRYRIIFKFVLFTIAAGMLYQCGYSRYAAAFGLVAVTSLYLEYYFDESTNI